MPAGQFGQDAAGLGEAGLGPGADRLVGQGLGNVGLADHDRAMDYATDKTVLADFNDTKFEYQGVTTRFFRRDGKYMVNTEGPDGQFHDYEIKYTFGVRPLQQYMVEFSDGRVQVLRESWDVKNKKWFFVQPPDVRNERIPESDK